MDIPPLPQPHAYTCSHCGHGWDFAQKYCPHCGAEYYRTVPGVPKSGNCFAAGCLALCGVLIGGLGACYMIVESIGSGDQGSSVKENYFMALAGVSGLYLLYLIIRFLIGK